MSSVRLAETYEEDSLTAVIGYVQSLIDGEAGEGKTDTAGARFAAECNKLVEAGRFDELITQLSSHLGPILSSASAKDAECCIAVMAHLVKKVPTEEAERTAASKLAAALTTAGKADEGQEARLNGLLALYAAAKGPRTKHQTLLAVLRAATASTAPAAAAAQLAPAVRGSVHEWARQWGLGDGETRDLYLAAAALLKAVGDRAGNIRLVTDALALVPASDAAGLTAVKGAALQAVKDWVASPDNFACDLTGLPAIDQLQKDTAAAPFLRLLQVMLSGDMKGYAAAATPAVLDAIPVAADAASEKMRLMALLGVAAQSAGRPVPLTEVRDALSIGDNEVQQWIVKAIGRHLLEGKIDQVAGTLTATRCHRRAFGANEWGSLARQLADLGEGLAQIAERLGAGGSGGAGALGGGVAKAAIRA